MDGLREFSSRIGADITLVQGAGGNTSLKCSETLIVKASGKRLADAMREDIFVSVSIADARAMSAPLPASGALRPSIETYMHAIMPHRVVAHVHSVDILSEAVRADAKPRLEERLDGMRWALVPYVRPGKPLAIAVQDAVSAGVDILVLANHGLMVGADDFEECEERIGEVRQRVATAPRRASASEHRLGEVAVATGLEPATHVEAHWSALDPVSMKIALSGTLYPDHVVFLGRGAAALELGKEAPRESPSGLFLVEGVGAFLRSGASPAAHEMAGCLGMVAARVAPGAPVRTLTSAQEDELLNWDAEKHRQRMAGATT